jgi:hypothetical protein
MLTVGRTAMRRLRRVSRCSVRTGIETARIGAASGPLRLPRWLLSKTRGRLTPVGRASRSNVGFELRRVRVGLSRTRLAVLVRLRFAPLLIARLLWRLLRPTPTVTLLLRKTALEARFLLWRPCARRLLRMASLSLRIDPGRLA